MKRQTTSLTQGEYDVLIVGGGIFGAFAAWDAALRGLTVVLVEKGDFGEATSSNHFKVVHGGIRYLQHLDIARVRESSSERAALLRIAPHLVYPLPIIVPTYGRGKRGRAVLRAGCSLFDLLTADRNRRVSDSARRIPSCRFLTDEEVLEQFPHLPQEGLTGGAVFCDGQIYNPPRLVLSAVRSAVEAGADAANYTEITGLLRQEDRIVGARALDLEDGTSFDIRARVVLNAAGAWAPELLRNWLDLDLGGDAPIEADPTPHLQQTVSTTPLRELLQQGSLVSIAIQRILESREEIGRADLERRGVGKELGEIEMRVPIVAYFPEGGP